MRSPPLHLLAPAAALAVLCLGGAGLGQAPFLPEEAARLLDPAGPWSLSFALAGALGQQPEVVARLPGLVAAAAAAALVTLAAGRIGAAAPGFLLAALSPALLAAGRTAGPAAFAALLGSASALAWVAPGRRSRAAAIVLLAAGVALCIAPRTLAAPDRPLAALLGVWGMLFGPGVPPWRLDVALPALACAVPLGWLGAGSTAGRRSLGVGVALTAAALLGAFTSRATFAAIAAAPLTPWCLLALARGAARRPRAIPGAALLATAIAAGGIGIADLHLGRDVLDPARRVAWDEAGRMVAVLAAGDARIEAAPTLPASLVLYAPERTLPAPGGATERRVLVVSHGPYGGPDRPGADIERGLGERGYTLRGELLLGDLEPGFAALVRHVTSRPAAAEYLRVRRYEAGD